MSDSFTCSGVLEFEAGTAEDGWKSVTNMFGVQVSSKPSPAEASRMMCKGRASLPSAATMELLENQFVISYNNNRSLPQQMRYSGECPAAARFHWLTGED